MEEKRKTEVVSRLAKAFGSQAEVARLLGIDKSTVTRWANVPAKYHRRLLDEAKRRKVALSHGDLVA
jgi:DNA invertase Pin-like site-specific DNA recombinase